jgi:hypothetical protein
MNLELWVYQALLKLYPRDFRQEYGQEMTRVFQESLASEGSSFGFWIRTFWDVISSATSQHARREPMPIKKPFIYLGGASLIALGVFDTLFSGQILWDDPLHLNRIGASNINLVFLFLASFGSNSLLVLNNNRTVTHHLGAMAVRFGILLETVYVIALFMTQWFGHPMLKRISFGYDIGQLTESDSAIIHAMYALGNAANGIARTLVLLGFAAIIVNQFLQHKGSFKKLALEWKITLMLIVYAVFANAMFFPILKLFFDLSGRVLYENQTIKALVFLHFALPNIGAICLGIVLLVKGNSSSNPPRIKAA